MKYYTKAWYNHVLQIGTDENGYQKYYAAHGGELPDWYTSRFRLHDSKIIHATTKKSTRGKDLTLKIFHDESRQIFLLKLRNAKIMESTLLAGKYLIADELYKTNGGYEFHLLLADDKNALSYFTAACAGIEKAMPDALPLYSLYEYCIPGRLFYESESFYNRKTKEIVLKERDSNRSSDPDLIPLPKLHNADLHGEFLQRLKSPKISRFLRQFKEDTKERRSAEYAILTALNREVFNTLTGDYEYFCLSKLKPIAKKWSNKHNIAIDTHLILPKSYILNHPPADEESNLP